MKELDGWVETTKLPSLTTLLKRQVCELEEGGTWRQIQDEFGEGVDEGVGRMGGAIDGMQAADRKPGENTLRKGKGNPEQGEQRTGGEMPRNCLRRCARPVPRPYGTFPNWRKVSRHKLPFHGRLCRQGLLQRRNGDAAGQLESEV